jgi:DNA-binding YbaB/EbfC family protein
MQIRGGLNELMRQAARVQRKIEEKKAEVADREVTATAVGDKVKVTATYARKISRIEVDPEFLKAEGMDLALDSVCAAVNGALEAADKAMEAEIGKVTGGMKIPGVV